MNNNLQVQTRDYDGSLVFFNTITEALAYAETNAEVWKISFRAGKEQVRLLRKDNEWVYSPIFGNCICHGTEEVAGHFETCPLKR